MHDIADIKKSFQQGNADLSFEIDGLPIALEEWFTRISIDLSGSANTALLTYLLMTELKNRKQNCEIHLLNHRRSNSSMIKWLTNYYINNKFHSVVVHQVVNDNEYWQYAKENFFINMHYDASISGRKEDLDRFRFVHYKNQEASPFSYITKDWIIKQYIDHDIMDLLNHTTWAKE